MYIMRPVTENDLDALHELAHKSSIGIINLPTHRDSLKKKITHSKNSFKKNIKKADQELYTFILEDLDTGKIGGTSGIVSRMGISEPNYYFRLENSQEDNSPIAQVLVPVCYPVGPSEICALYLAPELRKEGLGKLLSLSRFLFIANHMERFENFIVAEMRGYIEGNEAPFWDGLCRNFLNISYAEVCERELETRSFIPYILPKWPLYVCLLPKEVQAVLGKTHDKTVPALNMLYEEGFTFTQEIDPFDGGPKIGCKTDQIRSISESQVGKVSFIDENLKDDFSFLISNTKIEFRAAYGFVQTKINNNEITVSKQLAKALQLKTGDEIRYISLTHKPNKEKT